MGYSKEAFAYANDVFAKKRRKAENDLFSKKTELYKAVPRLAMIEKELSESGLRAVKAAISKSGNVKADIEALHQTNQQLQMERADILVRMGLPSDYLSKRPECPICADEGFVNGKMCECYLRELKKYTYDLLNKNSRLQLCDFSRFDLRYYPDSVRETMHRNFNFCFSYAENFSENSGNILMSGATGLGKTFLSLSIAKRVIEKGFGVIYASAQDLMNSLEKERFSNLEASNTLDAVLDCDLLIIDDLGAEFSTSFTLTSVYNIVNSRINLNKPVIISTNLSLQELQDKYSERVVSRFIGEYTVLHFLGNDIRQIKRMEGKIVG